MSDDTINRQAAVYEVDEMCYAFNVKTNAHWALIKALADLPPAQPEGWMERNKERILQAGMEGREIEFRIGGRLFAIREKAQ